MTRERRFTTARCRKCGDTIVSRHVHDYVTCTCGAIAVDGGSEYARYSGELDDLEMIDGELDE